MTFFTILLTSIINQHFVKRKFIVEQKHRGMNLLHINFYCNLTMIDNNYYKVIIQKIDQIHKSDQ